MVIFSDSQLAIIAIESWPGKPSKQIEQLVTTCDRMMRLYGIEITIQWIPRQTDIQNNEKDDKSSKAGSRMSRKQRDIF